MGDTEINRGWARVQNWPACLKSPLLYRLSHSLEAAIIVPSGPVSARAGDELAAQAEILHRQRQLTLGRRRTAEFVVGGGNGADEIAGPSERS
jgi:hypothetical protein